MRDKLMAANSSQIKPSPRTQIPCSSKNGFQPGFAFIKGAHHSRKINPLDQAPQETKGGTHENDIRYETFGEITKNEARYWAWLP